MAQPRFLDQKNIFSSTKKNVILHIIWPKKWLSTVFFSPGDWCAVVTIRLGFHGPPYQSSVYSIFSKFHRWTYHTSADEPLSVFHGLKSSVDGFFQSCADGLFRSSRGCRTLVVFSGTYWCTVSHQNCFLAIKSLGDHSVIITLWTKTHQNDCRQRLVT